MACDRDDILSLSLESSLRSEIAELRLAMSAKDTALVKANLEIDELRQQLAQSRQSNGQSTLATGEGSAGPTTQSSITAHSAPFYLTTAEWTLFDKVVKTGDCRSSSGNIRWELVAQKFAKAADHDTIYARDKERLQSSYRNLPTTRKAELNAAFTGHVETSASASASANSDSMPPIITTVPQSASSSSSSGAIDRTTTTTTTAAAFSSQSFMPIVRLKSEIDFSADERRMIKEWGKSKKQLSHSQEVSEKYLFQQHFQHFHAILNYARKGSELKSVWDNWWKDNKNRMK